MANPSPVRLIPIKEAAQLAAVSEVTIRRHIDSGKLQAVRLGEKGPIRVSTAALADWLRPHPASPQEPNHMSTSQKWFRMSEISVNQELARAAARVRRLAEAMPEHDRPPVAESWGDLLDSIEDNSERSAIETIHTWSKGFELRLRAGGDGPRLLPIKGEGAAGGGSDSWNQPEGAPNGPYEP